MSSKTDRLLSSVDGSLQVAYKDVRQVCITGSLYALLQYLLLFDEDTVKRHTCYFLGYAVGDKVSCNLPAVSVGIKQTRSFFSPLRWIEKIWLQIVKNYKYPFLKTAKIYALDAGFAAPLIGKRNYSLLSDGPNCMTMNMQENSAEYLRQIHKQHSFGGRLEGLLYGSVAIHTYGNNPQCTAFYMTEKNNSFVYGERPVYIASLQEMWDAATENKRSFVRRVFNVSEEDIALLNGRKVMFLTQPLILDCHLTEEEYVAILREVFAHYDLAQVILKLHPRDNFDYKRYFPDILVYNKAVNMQLLVLLGANVERAVTICSSSVNAFPNNVEVDWFGPAIHPKLSAFYGDNIFPARPYNQL